MNKKLSLLIKACITSRKVSKVLFSTFIIFSTFLILLSVCLIFPLGDNIENNINNHIVNRELYLEYPGVADKKDIKEDIEKMKKVEHVTAIYPIPPTFDATENKGVLKSNYKLDYIHVGYTPIIIDGRCYKEVEKNVAIVPKTIKDYDSSIAKTKTIDGKDLIGKTLEFTYYKDFTYKAKVVGTYDTTDPIFSGNEILVPRNDLYHCKEILYKNLKVIPNMSKGYFYQITIDHYKNIPTAHKELSEIYKVDNTSSLNIDTELFNTCLIVLMVALVIFSFMIIAGLFIFLESSIKNRTKELALYRSMGFNSKHLFDIIFMEHLIFGIVALAVGIMTTALVNHYFVNPYLYSLLGNTIMDMTADINILYILIIIIFFITVLYFVCRQTVKKSEKTDLTILLKEH